MKIYAIIGESQETVVLSDSYQPAENEVLMNSPRPDIDYIATAEGEWVKDIKVELAKIDKQIKEVEEKQSSLRTLREAALGNQNAIQRIQEAETKIAELRKKRVEILANI